MTILTVPLHKMQLVSELVKGEVTIAVRPQLPMDGVDVILGNDLARGWVCA